VEEYQQQRRTRQEKRIFFHKRLEILEKDSNIIISKREGYSTRLDLKKLPSKLKLGTSKDENQLSPTTREILTKEQPSHLNPK
jgi:hypothetical protein